jgi:hypothetical protein
MIMMMPRQSPRSFKEDQSIVSNPTLSQLTSSQRTVCSSRHRLRRWTKDCIDRCVKKFRISVRALGKALLRLLLLSGDDDNDNETILEEANEKGALVVFPTKWLDDSVLPNTADVADECTLAGARNAVVRTAIAATRSNDTRRLAMLLNKRLCEPIGAARGQDGWSKGWKVVCVKKVAFRGSEVGLRCR